MKPSRIPEARPHDARVTVSNRNWRSTSLARAPDRAANDCAHPLSDGNQHDVHDPLPPTRSETGRDAAAPNESEASKLHLAFQCIKCML
jgi:hypothetical protein